MYTELVRRYRVYCRESTFWSLSALSLATFFLSLVVNNYAITYATDRASNPVTDLILSNIPVFDVDAFFVYGAVLLIAFIAAVILAHPKRIPFTLYALALFYFTRAAFISLTHLGPFPIHTPINFSSDLGIFLSKIFFGGDDLFFSAHTGAPFLMALLFWKERWLRYMFLAWSVFFAVVVLLGHIHYSIDVASAFFITYGVYHLALWLVPKAEALFSSNR